MGNPDGVAGAAAGEPEVGNDVVITQIEFDFPGTDAGRGLGKLQGYNLSAGIFLQNDIGF